MKLIFQYSPWFILLCLILGGVYAFLLYRKDRRLSEFSKGLIIFLGSLRFLSAAFLAFLLLSPLIKYFSREVEEPILIIAQDHSASMVQAYDSTEIKEVLPTKLAALKNSLSDEFQVEHYYFGERVRPAEKNLAYIDRFTNFEVLFDQLSDRYENRNVGAVLLISDGIYNLGLNPLYSENFGNHPIYTYATGDTNQRKDLLISQLISNKIAFLGNKFPIRLDYRAMMAKGENSKLKLYHKGKLLESRELKIENEQQAGSIELLIEAKESGLQTYTVELEGLENEISLENNRENLYIDILDSRQKILLLYASPHPDIAAIQRSISSSENYQLEVKQWDKRPANLESYDLLIMHSILRSNLNELDQFLKQAGEKDKAIFQLADMGVDWPQMSKHYPFVQISRQFNEFNEVYPLYDESFPLFQLSEEQLAALEQYPPLKVPQMDIGISDRAYVLFRQQIGSVPTKSPLLFFAERDAQKYGFLLGEGIWRWRMNNYSRYGDHLLFDQLITKLVQYLSVKSDKSYFRISHDKEVLENQPLRFDLQLFNKSYDLVNDPEAFMVIENEEGKQFNYQFNRSANAYFLELEGLDVGNYSYTAYTNFGQKRLEEKGKFSIREIKTESVNLKADHNLLYQIAANSGGEMFYELDSEQLLNKLSQREDIAAISYSSEEVEDIINLKWLFFVLIGLIGLEWFIRKYQGAY